VITSLLYICMMNNIGSLKASIRKTGIASTTGLKKKELQQLRYKIRAYDGDTDSPILNDNYKQAQFINKTIQLTDEQHNIVIADKDCHYKVIACAGSGKTTTILCRIKFLVDSGVKPWQILLTTFNVDAAENMKSKMQELFGFKTNIYVGTIDALACRFYNSYFKRPDFIGVTEYCTELLKFLIADSDKAKKLKSRFQYVFFDEFQDCNDVQFDIIKEFAKISRVTVIGDDAQNIYQWRGSNMDFILNFENYVENIVNTGIDTENPKKLQCKIMTLKKNFRSTPEIIDLANASIKNNTDQIPKDMISVNRSYERLPKVYKYENEEEQSLYTLAYIIRYVQNKIPQEQIAVLARNNYSLKYIEETIEKHNIKVNTLTEKVRISTNIDQIQNIDIEPIINYVALINDDTKDTKPKIMKNHITLTTIHKAKGLEWDVVFVLSCNDDKFPSETTSVKLQEDRRLFYVAATRAKRYLNFSFTSKSITRFIGELDRSLYSFDKYDQAYFKYKDDRNIKFKNGVTQLIEMLEPRDIEFMRDTGLLPQIIPHTSIIHKSHKYSDYIDKYYLQSDYGTYIDRYVSRRFGIVCPSSGGLIDTVANKVLHTVNLTKELHEIYSIYNYNIQRKYDLYVDINISDAINKIDRSSNDPCYIQTIESKHKKNVLDLLTILRDRAKEINIAPSQLHIAPSNYMPYEYRSKFELSYQKFRKVDNNCDAREIRRDVYNVSLCQNIFDGRRRLLYKDCFDEFDTDESLYLDIDDWVNRYRHRKIVTKMSLINKSLGICGELDLIDLSQDFNSESNNIIIDIKCSLNSEYKLEWTIQLMMYSALYKHVHGKIINKLGVYNPLKGTYTDVDLENWNLHNELLVFMDNIRTKRMNNK
jgi:hypothetical protein